MNADRNHELDIDRLVDGELPSESRKTLLVQLDSIPNGWKRCALGFLEAQAWRAAFGETQQAAPSPTVVEVRPKRRRITPWLSWAAMLVAAFVMGWALRPSKPATLKERVAILPLPSIHPGPVSPRPAPIMARAPSTNSSPHSYLQGRLEREGFQLERDRVLVPATTKEGRTVAVPVQRIRVRYVGNRAV